MTFPTTTSSSSECATMLASSCHQGISSSMVLSKGGGSIRPPLCLSSSPADVASLAWLRNHSGCIADSNSNCDCSSCHNHYSGSVRSSGTELLPPAWQSPLTDPSACSGFLAASRNRHRSHHNYHSYKNQRSPSLRRNLALQPHPLGAAERLDGSDAGPWQRPVPAQLPHASMYARPTSAAMPRECNPLWISSASTSVTMLRSLLPLPLLCSGGEAGGGLLMRLNAVGSSVSTWPAAGPTSASSSASWPQTWPHTLYWCSAPRLASSSTTPQSCSVASTAKTAGSSSSSSSHVASMPPSGTAAPVAPHSSSLEAAAEGLSDVQILRRLMGYLWPRGGAEGAIA